MIEIFKDILGYEGLYQISNFGNVKSFPNQQHNGRLLKPCVNGNGYVHLYLCNNGRKLHSVHRLVATAFLQNLQDKPQVNHINGDRTDNRLENLEWVTKGENERHKYTLGYKGLRPWLGKKSGDHARSASVAQYTISGEFVKKWECITDIYRELGFSRGNISTVCKGKRKVANGFIWKYSN